MSKQLKKSFRHGLSKIKVSNKHLQHSFRGCKMSRTPSLCEDENEAANGVTLSAVDQFLFENFRSLYMKEYEADVAKRTSFQFESPRLLEPPPIENLVGSSRFFVPSRSSSSMIADELGAKSEEEEEHESRGGGGGDEDPTDYIAILTYSPSPYDDFRQSMEEMVEARIEKGGEVDWDFMEELLFCYLDLNSRKAYRYIVRAFVDLVVMFRENSGRVPVTAAEVREGGGGGSSFSSGSGKDGGEDDDDYEA